MPIQAITKIVIAMGEGDVLTGMALDEHGVGHFVFQASPIQKKPGTPAPELDSKYDLGDADVVVMFKDESDVSRLIASLSILREKMRVAK